MIGTEIVASSLSALNGSGLSDAFRAADSQHLPALRKLDERQQMFWVLRLGQEQIGLATMTPGEISTVLRDAFGTHIPRQRIEATLSAEKGTVVKRRREGRRAYQLMAKGSEELEGSTDGAMLIDPGSGYTGLRETHALLGTVEGEIRVCDPYVEARTLDMLAECSEAESIRLLTHNLKRPDGLKQVLKAFEREHGFAVEIRKAPTGVLHDRYLIHEGGMLMFGTSLNGLGLKQSLVVALGPDVRAATLASFEGTWDQAKKFWPAN